MRSTWVAVAAVLLLAPSVQAGHAGGGGPDSVEYPVSPSELKLDFLSDNRFDLQLPGVGTVIVEGVQEQVYHNRTIQYLDENGEVVRTEPMRDIFVDGRIANQPDSRVDIVLGEYGVYGVVFLDAHKYELNPRKANDFVAPEYIQEVTRERATGYDPYNATDDFLSRVEPESGSADYHDSDSPLIFDAEWSYRSEHGDWESRINSAYDRYDDLYQSSPTNIPLSIYRVRAVEEFTAGGTGDQINQTEALKDYRDKISGAYGEDGVDAYQLWTGIDLVQDETGPNDYRAWGLSWDQAVGQREDSTSIMEGYDANCCDGYDPDDNDDRGAVSAHEFGHTYGQEDHAGEGDHPEASCGPWGYSCPIMDDPDSANQYAFSFTDDTEEELWHRYHAECNWEDTC